MVPCMTSARMQTEFKRGVATAKTGNARLAKQYFQQALELHTGNTAEIWIWLAWLADSPGTAVQCLECALDESPGHPIASRALEWSRHMANYEAPSPVPEDDPLPDHTSASSPSENDAERDPEPLVDKLGSLGDFGDIDVAATVVDSRAAMDLKPARRPNQHASAVPDSPLVADEIITGEVITDEIAVKQITAAQIVPDEVVAEEGVLAEQLVAEQVLADQMVADATKRLRSTDDFAALITDQISELEFSGHSFLNTPTSEESENEQPAVHETSSTINTETVSWRETVSTPPDATPTRQPYATAPWRRSSTSEVAETTSHSESNANLGWRAELLSRSQSQRNDHYQEPEDQLAESIEELASVVAPSDFSSTGFSNSADYANSVACTPSVETDEETTDLKSVETAESLDHDNASDDPSGENSLDQHIANHDPADHDARPLVLVVDDSPTVRKLVTMTLERHGYRVIGACDGVAAIREIATQPPQLVLLDINMPRLDGYKLCKLIKKHESTSAIPVVMLAGKDGMFDRLRGRLVGCSDYITKPFDSNSLVSKVSSYLSIEMESVAT